MTSQADTLFADIYTLDAAFFGADIYIQRGPLRTAPITGIVDVVESGVQESAPDNSIKVSSRNYEIAVSDYAFNGETVEPKATDRIVETINGVECKFQPMKPSKDLPAWEKLDSDGVRWLIRTKLVGSA